MTTLIRISSHIHAIKPAEPCCSSLGSTAARLRAEFSAEQQIFLRRPRCPIQWVPRRDFSDGINCRGGEWSWPLTSIYRLGDVTPPLPHRHMPPWRRKRQLYFYTLIMCSLRDTFRLESWQISMALLKVYGVSIIPTLARIYTLNLIQHWHEYTRWILYNIGTNIHAESYTTFAHGSTTENIAR